MLTDVLLYPDWVRQLCESFALPLSPNGRALQGPAQSIFLSPTYSSKTFSYDLNGNMTAKADAGLQTTYIYDVEDRLVRVERGSSSVIAEYHYDPFGRRLWKDIDGMRTYFLYCDEGLVGEYDASGAELRTYGWAP